MENMQENKKHYYVWFKLLALLCVTAIVIVSVVMALKSNEPDYQFSVSAVGKVFAKPDIANLSVGFQTEVKKSAAEAVKENTDKMNQVVEELKNLGIESSDIKTTTYSLNPVYDWTEKSGQTLRGYQVTQQVTIKIRDLDKIGEAIAKTTEKGANQIGNINFTIDDEDALKSQAREEAIVKAKEKAVKVAELAGIKLGKIVNVYENQVYYPTPTRYYGEVGMGGGGSEAPAIEAGENEVVVEVNLIYEVK
jgi:uncharacterized protein YggE